MANKGFSISNTGNTEIVKRLHKLEDGGKTAIQRTVLDFTSRAPAWVSKGIRENYGVDAKAIKKAAKRPRRGVRGAKIVGIEVGNAILEYEGRLLTLKHFKMSPAQQPKARQKEAGRVPGEKYKNGNLEVATLRPPKPYRVKATIIKGRRVTFPEGTFVAPNKRKREVNGEKPDFLPFQRKDNAPKAYPIEAVRTLSVPQMIDGRARETIQETLDANLSKRFEHHMKQIMK